ncbi:MAG: type IV pilus secretin PilQ [Deltaproteobacteria bacterium]|nr:type IV pilus secretin PilQ [Deltaproteobacteria bacterium]
MEVFFKKSYLRLFWGVLIILFFASPSFPQAPPEKATPFSILKIEMTETSKGSRVTIEGSRAFDYAAYKMANPLRVVVELPQAQLGKLVGPIEVQNGIVNVIRNIQVEDPTKPGARVEIALEQNVEYSLESEKNLLYVDLVRPSAAVEVKEEKREALVEKPLKPAKVLKELDILAKTDWVKVDLRGDGTMPDHKSFQLTKPSRLVVDLPRLSNASSKRNIDVGSKLLKDIRIGQHPDKLRLVFTFPETRIPPFQLAKEGESLTLLLARTQEEMPARETPPVAPPAKPVEIVEAIPKAEAVPKAEVVAKAEPAPKAEVEPKVEAVPKAEVVPKAEEEPKPEVAPKAEAKPEAAVPAPEEKPEIPEKKIPAEVKPVPAEVVKPVVTPYKGAKISLDFKDADIHNIFRLIAEVSNLNIITTEDVKGKITIRLVNVPWDQALDVILSTKNLIKIEEGNVLRITTIETVKKEREDKQKEEESLLKTRETKLKLEEPERKILKVNYADATELQKLLLEQKELGKGFLSPQGSVKADKRTNTLIIQDIRNRLEAIEQLIKDLDSPTPQVLIEARVVQAQTTFGRSLGSPWGGSSNQIGGGQWFWGLTGNNPSASAGWGFTPSATGASTPLIMPSNFVVNFPATTANTPVGGFGISFGKLTGSLVNLDLRLQLGETDGQTKVIARPKLATLDNKEAHIKQGEKIPYETTSQAGTQVQFIDAVLSLKVTPHVTPDGSILMKVMVTRDARGAFRSPINQVPSIDNREASTEVLVKDGETLVIGGIYETEKSTTEHGIPWLMKIPILGWLFKNQEVFESKKELLIFITPTIIQTKVES